MTRKNITPPDDLAATIAALRARLERDARAEELPPAARLPAPSGLPPGTYRLNEDGTLTPLDD